MEAQSTYVKVVGTSVIFFIVILYAFVNIQNNKIATQMKSEILHLASPEQAELCPYTASYIGPNCVKLRVEQGLMYFSLIKRSKSSSTVPSKVKKSFKKVLRFKKSDGNTENLICIIVFKLKGFNEKYYFSPIDANNNCTKINEMSGGYLISE